MFFVQMSWQIILSRKLPLTNRTGRTHVNSFKANRKLTKRCMIFHIYIGFNCHNSITVLLPSPPPPRLLTKDALQTGVQVADDVLEENNVNRALAKRIRKTIGRLVAQAGSSRKSTKRKVQFRGLTSFKKRTTKISCFGHLVDSFSEISEQYQ